MRNSSSLAVRSNDLSLAPVECLPPELVQTVLEKVELAQDLVALIKASPACYRVFVSNRCLLLEQQLQIETVKQIVVAATAHRMELKEVREDPETLRYSHAQFFFNHVTGLNELLKSSPGQEDEEPAIRVPPNLDGKLWWALFTLSTSAEVLSEKFYKHYINEKQEIQNRHETSRWNVTFDPQVEPVDLSKHGAKNAVLFADLYFRNRDSRVELADDEGIPSESLTADRMFHLSGTNLVAMGRERRNGLWRDTRLAFRWCRDFYTGLLRPIEFLKLNKGDTEPRKMSYNMVGFETFICRKGIPLLASLMRMDQRGRVVAVVNLFADYLNRHEFIGLAALPVTNDDWLRAEMWSTFVVGIRSHFEDMGHSKMQLLADRLARATLFDGAGEDIEG
jgi:hypothetical protein